MRYLSRLIKNHDYEISNSSTETASIDAILDLSLRLSRNENNNISLFITKFASYLNKSQWLLDLPNPSIADVAGWSVIKQKGLDKIPKEIKRWYDLCEKTFLAS